MLTMPAFVPAGGPSNGRVSALVSRTPTARWLPLMVGLAAAAVTLGLWQALLAQERGQISQTTALQLESVRNEIAVRLESRLLALRRMARRWELRGQPPREEWESDAALYVHHYAGYLGVGWIDAALNVNWAAPAPAGTVLRELAAGAGRWRERLLEARVHRDVTLTPVSQTGGGEAVFQVNLPIFHDGTFGGFIVGVFRAHGLFDAILRSHIAPGYGIEIHEADRLIYRRGARGTGGQQADVAVHGLSWRVRVWPQPEILAATLSVLPQAVLAGGLAQALLLAIAVYLAQIARARTVELERANRELRIEVAERQQAQELLRKLSRAVEQSPTMVMITDTRGAVEYVNPRFTQITGYPLEEILGQNPRLLKSGDTDVRTYQQLWETITNGGEWRGELRDRKKSGELFWIHTAISPIRDARGVITHFLAEMEDVTRRKLLEQEVGERNREIVKTQALAAMGQAASMIAHDLRNPLSSIKMALQMLGKQPRPEWTEETRELQQIALEQVRYMEEVLTDLLTYSRPDALKPEWLSVDKLLDRAILLAQRGVDEYDVTVVTEYQPGLPTLHGDAHKLQQALSNLVMNAIQATEGINGATPQVTVRAAFQLAADGPFVEIDIRDNGSGIPVHALDQVFEPFFTTRARGTGLGLSIAKRIVDQHRGTIGLHPIPGGGTCARVSLPTGPVAGYSVA